MKALVTGATGFIGSHLAEELLRRGYRVTCLVRKTSSLRWLEGLDAEIIHGDCEDEDSLRELPTDIDLVFHLAGLTKAKKTEDFFSANARGTENLLRAVSRRASGLRRFLYLSSLAAVGPSASGAPVDENVTPAPVSSYGKSKLEGEEALLRHKSAVPVTVIRPPAVYGPRDRDLYLFFKMVKKGFYPHWGKCYYSLLYVDDLVEGMITAATARGTEGETFFLSDGSVYSNEEIAEEIMRVMNAKGVRMKLPKTAMTLLVEIGEKLGGGTSIINRDKLRELRHSHWVCEAGKAQKEFRFIPKVTMKEGIKWTADWYRIHQWL